MNLGFLLIFIIVVTVVQGFLWPLETIKNLWMGSNCPERSQLAERIENFEDRVGRLLIGQPLVYKTLYSVLKAHFMETPQKPLVISMHGWTGSGKTFLSQIVVETLYTEGIHNRNVHFFSGRFNFPLATEEAVNEYKMNLQNWIEGNVSRCGFSTFIFDEMDKVPPEVINGIKPFLDYYPVVNKVDYRNSIFIFLSNVGANIINKKYIELWESGISRNKMEYRQFEPILRKTLFYSDGIFRKSALLADHLISVYLPFLPMEREHIKLCIKREMEKQKVEVTEEGVESVLDSMEFFHSRFSLSGCKRVSDQVSLLKYVRRDEL